MCLKRPARVGCPIKMFTSCSWCSPAELEQQWKGCSDFSCGLEWRQGKPRGCWRGKQHVWAPAVYRGGRLRGREPLFHRSKHAGGRGSPCLYLGYHTVQGWSLN